jgi:hypothetical protein
LKRKRTIQIHITFGKKYSIGSERTERSIEMDSAFNRHFDFLLLRVGCLFLTFRMYGILLEESSWKKVRSKKGGNGKEKPDPPK